MDLVAPGALTLEERRRITDLSAGNPLAIRSLALEPDGVRTSPPGHAVAVPRVVAEAFARRTAGMQADELRVLQLVVVASGDLPTIAAACAAEGLSLELLGRAEALGIATVTPYRVDLTHPLVASAVYAGIAPDERRRLHAVVADSLLPGDGDRRAWHRSEAVLGTDDDVAAELEQVGIRASRRGAFAVASSAHERAGTLSADPEVRAARFLAAGEAAWLAGEDARAPALLHEAARHAPQPVVRARALAMAGQVAARGGSLVQSRDLLMAAAGDAEDEAPDESLLMYAAVVDVCFYLLDADGARTAAGRAERLLARDAAPPRGASAIASVAVGMGRIVAGEPGSDWLRAGVQGLVRHPGTADQEADFAVTGLLYLRETGAARDLLGETIESRRRDSRLGQLPHLLFHLARSDATTDRWSHAEAQYSEAVDLAREFGQLTELGASLAGLAVVHARQGRVEECRRLAAEATQVGAGRGVRMASAWTGFALAELDLSLGEVSRGGRGLHRAGCPAGGPAGRGSRPVAGPRARRGVGAHG